MEDEENLKENTGKGTQAKTFMKKYKTYQYIVEATQIPNSNIN